MIYKRNKTTSNLGSIEDALQIDAEANSSELDLGIDNIRIVENSERNPTSTQATHSRSRSTDRSTRNRNHLRSTSSSSSSASSYSSSDSFKPYFVDQQREKERIVALYKCNEKQRRHKKRVQRYERYRREDKERKSRRHQSKSPSRKSTSCTRQVSEPTNRKPVSTAPGDSNKQPQIIIVPIPQPAYPMGPYMQPQTFQRPRIPYLHPPNGLRPQMPPPPLPYHHVPLPPFRQYFPQHMYPMRPNMSRKRNPCGMYPRRPTAQYSKYPRTNNKRGVR